ncbi:MAG: exodeoxyribonuclease VII small subunit [Synergistota bacterium]|nr:exodeoxyribonuclease VII small subunit [Synergistota bacterium]
MGFTQNMEKLQEIISVLDEGKIPLEDAMALFEEGVTIVKACRDYLEDTRQKIELLDPDRPGEEGDPWDPLSETEGQS